ncbi:MAG: hypothetical protein OXG69_12630 [bacterium]|nr:hypothetical protein [bacterium]
MRLDVLIESHHAGHVDILGPDRAVFAYAESYLTLADPTRRTAMQQWRLRETDTARSLAQLAKALGLSAADVGTRAEHLAAGLPSALADVVNGLTAHEQDTLDNLDLVRQVVTRSSRCAATAAELRPPG